ncbi:MAG: NAD(P)/FAD-dependent oxidoreductase [Candidatus Aenigmarchaeota archaeon]|nr:NAD(P)/FAD-dependent oxidoreductase [Candidatus Aenigmarchaeota archaeon]
MYDVIIAGAGVAGCQIARLLDDSGLDTLVLEKEKNIRIKDSGIVSSEFLDFFPKYLIAKNIDSMDIVSPSGIEINLSLPEPFAHIVHRESFSGYLRRKIKIDYETVIAAKFYEESVTVLTDKGFHECKLLVGCDGANSVIRNAAGIERPGLCAGIFSRGRKSTGNVTVYMNKFFSPDFFAWHIPQNGEHGLITAMRPAGHMDEFETALGLEQGNLYGAHIPIGLQKSFSSRCLLAGDAASQVKPLTGGGIIFSLKAAKHAAETIRKAAKKNRFDAAFLSSYQKRWLGEFGAEIRKQMMIRNVYRRLPNKHIDQLFSAFKPDFEKIRAFNYDRLSKLCWKLPKLKMLRFLPWLLVR